MNSIIFPLAQSDASMLEHVKEPGFAQWAVYLFVFIWLAEKIHGWITRHAPKKAEVVGSIETTPKPTFATEGAVKALEEEVQAMREENVSQHQAAALAGQHRVQDLSRVFGEETKELERRIETFEEKLSEKIEQGFASLHEKMNLTALQVAGHHAQLPGFEKRLEELTARYNKAIPDLHKRIDDAMTRKRP